MGAMNFEIIRQGWGGASILAKFAFENEAERYMEDYKWRHQGESYVFMQEIPQWRWWRTSKPELFELGVEYPEEDLPGYIPLCSIPKPRIPTITMRKVDQEKNIPVGEKRVVSVKPEQKSTFYLKLNKEKNTLDMYTNKRPPIGEWWALD